MPPPTKIWFCCQCHEGPYSFSVVASCYNCQHQFCKPSRNNLGCSVQETPHVESDVSSMCVHNTPGIPRSTLYRHRATSTDISLSTTALADSFSSLTSDGPKIFPTLPPNLPTYSMPLSAINFDIYRFAGTGSTATSEYVSPNQRPGFISCPEGEVIVRWNCCACGGENGLANDAGCAYCSNHWRCGRCEVVQYTKK